MNVKRARHKCNACQRLFDCEPCKHTIADDRVYCSDPCTRLGAVDTPGASFVGFMGYSVKTAATMRDHVTRAAGGRRSAIATKKNRPL